MEVPLDYTHPAGKKIKLSLLRLPSDGAASQKIGSLLTNPGGPGGSGIDYLRSAGESIFSTALRSRFDIVSWDPRGVGASTPVECVDGATYDRFYHLDPSPDTEAEKQALIDSSKEYDAACEAHSGELLPFMTTTDSARDMEQIRIALGEPKLSYLGFSYGTFLGTVYAGLFPDRVRAFTLDGALDPAISPEESLIQQALGFEKALDTFLDDCSKDTSCQFNNNGNAGGAFDTLMKQIDAKPLPALVTGDSRLVGPGEATTGVFYALYSRSSWSILAQGLAAAQRGDGSILLLLSDAYNQRQPDGTYSNEFAAFFAVNCTDAVLPTDPAAAEAIAAKLIPQAPRVGATFAYGTLGYACTYWPVRAEKNYGTITAAGSPPILVVGTTGDPATPYQWAVSLSKELASGVLLTRKGEGHTGYSDSTCIQQKVDTYLLTLQTPPPNTVCDP